MTAPGRTAHRPADGTARPAATDRRNRAAQLAAGWIARGRRVELQGIADELGISRATLFRTVGTRDELIGEALWELTRRTLLAAQRHGEAEHARGGLRSLAVGRHMNALVSRSDPLRRLLDEEPALTIRLLTDPAGPVQPRVVAFVEQVLRRDMADGYQPLIDPADLAFALVRLGESFLYADVLAARHPDVAAADRLQQALLHATRT